VQQLQAHHFKRLSGGGKQHAIFINSHSLAMIAWGLVLKLEVARNGVMHSHMMGTTCLQRCHEGQVTPQNLWRAAAATG
jgi:hypothetical protein